MVHRKGFPCSLCKKWVEEKFAYTREYNKKYGNQPCPDCGRISQKVVELVDCYDDYKKKYISCSECVPAMGDIDYIWYTDRVCCKCFSKLEKKMKQNGDEINDSPVSSELQSKERDKKIKLVKEDIVAVESKIEHEKKCHSQEISCQHKVENNNNQTGLIQENNELRQQLTAVQTQLAEVLEELKKLKNNSVGQNNEKLEQQIVQDEKLIKSGAKVSEAEIREQLQKSEALLKGASASVVPAIDNKNGNGSLPYVIGSSVLVAAVALIGYFLVKKQFNKKSKNKS